MPLPSSLTSTTTASASCAALSRSVASGGLPAANRSAGSSIPWSRLLRTRCSNGSPISSRTSLSAAVSSPSVTRRTCLSSLRARSRTRRGKRWNATDTGSIRMSMTAAWISPARRSSTAYWSLIWRDSASSPYSSSAERARKGSAFLATTSSPASSSRQSILAWSTLSARPAEPFSWGGGGTSPPGPAARWATGVGAGPAVSGVALSASSPSRNACRGPTSPALVAASAAALSLWIGAPAALSAPRRTVTAEAKRPASWPGGQGAASILRWAAISEAIGPARALPEVAAVSRSS